MAGLADLCGQITEGFTLCGKTPSTPGVQDRLFAYNAGEFTETYDPANPLIVTGLTPIGDAVLYEITGAGDSFDTQSQLQKKSAGPRYQELVMFNIADNSTAVKKLIVNGSAGRVKFIALNNAKNDSTIELFGAVNGLQFTENTVRKASDEDIQGGWKVEAGNPKLLLELYPPRAVLIPASGGGSATYATTLAALEALLTNA